MKPRLLGLTSLPLLVLAACSGDPGENARSSDDGLNFVYLTISNVHMTASESSVTITYLRGASSPFTVSLSGPNGTTSLPEGSVNGSAGVVFTGLQECTPFTFSILSAGVSLQSGNVHTLQIGGVACPASETIAPTRSYQFEGAYHWRNNAAWCYPSGWNPGLKAYPLDDPWWYVHQGGGGVGYTHHWDPGADPFPCQEQFVDVTRSYFDWQLDASRQRRVQSASVVATVDPESKQVCVNEWQQLGLTVWGYPQSTILDTNDYGQPWNSVFPAGIGTGRGMDIIQGSIPIPLTINGSSVSADVTSTAVRGYVTGGFAVPNDGFPTPTGSRPDHSIYPEDNNSCATGMDNVGLKLNYNAIQPDTPMNCSATTYCAQFVVTCDAAPETFQVHQSINGFEYTYGTAQGSTSGKVTISGTTYSTAPFYVCTTAGSLRSCTGNIPVTVAETCSTGGGGGGGTSSGGNTGCKGGTCKQQ
jgi:hypothetical protein